jgi:hypothetical protein
MPYRFDDAAFEGFFKKYVCRFVLIANTSLGLTLS